MPRVPSDAAAHVGRQIHQARLHLALTQDDLGSASGIDSSNIRALESGRAMPSVHTLVRLAVALNVEPGQLLEGLTLELFARSESDGRRRGT